MKPTARVLFILIALVAVLTAAALVGACDNGNDDDIVAIPIELTPTVEYAHEACVAGQLDRSAHTLRFVSTTDSASVLEAHRGITCAFQALNAPVGLTSRYVSTNKESGVQTAEWGNISVRWTFDTAKGVDLTFKGK